MNLALTAKKMADIADFKKLIPALYGPGPDP
jgi:hypothetical protein